MTASKSPKLRALFNWLVGAAVFLVAATALLTDNVGLIIERLWHPRSEVVEFRTINSADTSWLLGHLTKFRNDDLTKEATSDMTDLEMLRMIAEDRGRGGGNLATFMREFEEAYQNNMPVILAEIERLQANMEYNRSRTSVITTVQGSLGLAALLAMVWAAWVRWQIKTAAAPSQ